MRMKCSSCEAVNTCQCKLVNACLVSTYESLAAFKVTLCRHLIFTPLYYFYEHGSLQGILMAGMEVCHNFSGLKKKYRCVVRCIIQIPKHLILYFKRTIFVAMK